MSHDKKHNFPHSSSLADCSYDPAAKTMRITFATGGQHEYEDVAQDVHDGLKAAESPGSYFHQNIRRYHKSKKLD